MLDLGIISNEVNAGANVQSRRIIFADGIEIKVSWIVDLRKLILS